MAKTTWRKELDDALKANNEDWKDVAGNTLTEKELDTIFDNGYGGSEGCPFTLWTNHRVYFPVVYDGAEWVGSVPRDPCNEKTSHHGGE